MGQQQVVKTVGGDTIKAADTRIKMSGSFSVDPKEFPDPEAEVTITLHGTVEGFSVDRTGPAKKKAWTESVTVVADKLISIEARIPEKDPELPLDDASEPTSIDSKRAKK